jgi:hypothetical protein
MPFDERILFFTGLSLEPLKLIVYGSVAPNKPQDFADRQGLTCITESHLRSESRARCCDERGTNKLDESTWRDVPLNISARLIGEGQLYPTS